MTTSTKSTTKLNFDDRISLNFEKYISPGTGHLSISFTGIINKKLNGFYRIKSKTNDGMEKHGAVTHFEATGAREAFVCFDNPDMKSTFDLVLIVPKGLTYLSNMPVNYTKEIDNEGIAIMEIAFQRTAKMSTYLVAYAVGSFDSVNGMSKDGKTMVKMNTPLHRSNDGRFGLNVSINSLNFFSNYFKIPYSLPKLDLLTVPNFDAGAMENWGLIIAKESALLTASNSNSFSQRQYVATIICHEIAHQWFGDLVTAQWWSQIWLHEGFATIMSSICVDNLFPEFEKLKNFVSEYQIQPMFLDGLQNSHSIEVTIENPSEINEIFDDISYAKGGCILRMLRNWIGDEVTIIRIIID